MRLPLLLALTVAMAGLPAGKAADPPPAPPGHVMSEEDFAVPSWVPIEPPCAAEGQPAAQPQQAQPAQAFGSTGSAAEPEVGVAPASGDGALRFSYDSGEGAVTFRYQEGEEAPSRIVRLDFGALLEVEDEDGDGRPGPGDPVLGKTVVKPPLLHYARYWEASCGIRIQWVYLLTVTADDLQGMDGQEQAAFLEDKPRLALRFTHLAEPDGGIRPERVKIDIGIEGYPFSSPSSLLALSATLDSSDEAQAGATQVSSSLDGTAVGYSWMPEALADGKAVPVQAAVVPEAAGPGAFPGSSANITFAYPQAQSILHDPELGLLGVAGLRTAFGFAEADARALGAGMAAGAALLLAIGIGRRRWP